MKTDDLVEMLATGSGRIDRHVSTRRYAMSLALGIPITFLLMYYILRPLPYLGDAITWPKFWMKVAFAGLLALAGFMAVSRLARPGVRLGHVLAGVLVPVAAIWMGAAFVLLNAAPEERGTLMLGQTWAVCPFLIAMLSAPIFVSLLWAVRGLAPTKLAHAGAACGLFSGAMGALIYSLHCPEMEAPFVGSWYLLGILIPTGLGFILGRTTLRW